MANQHKTIGWIQLFGGIVALGVAVMPQGSVVAGLAILGLVFIATGYDHVTTTHR